METVNQLQETNQLARVISTVLIMTNALMDSVCWHVLGIRVVSMLYVNRRAIVQFVHVHQDTLEIHILNAHLKEINPRPSVILMTIVHLIVHVIKENVLIHVL